ncbi:MAG TPA: cysteine hydrolase [Burkholderiales bacterium]|nr:cysteine hydrolase [Burkholderiales bacterium]
MASVDILDRSTMTAKLYEGLAIDPKETAVVAIDMHRGHLDMSVATMPIRPEDAERVIGNASAALALARSHGVPVIHVVLVYRKIPGLGSEGMTQPFWRALHDLVTEEDRLTPGRRSTVNGHNLEGSPGTQIIPALLAPGDYVIDNKKRLDCFQGTDLKALLDALRVRTVCFMGINTNTCVLNTSFTAFNHDYRVVVLSDCVGSMYGDDLHVLGLQNVARCLGWVIDNRQLEEKLAAASATRPVSRPTAASA